MKEYIKVYNKKDRGLNMGLDGTDYIMGFFFFWFFPIAVSVIFLSEMLGIIKTKWIKTEDYHKAKIKELKND